MIINSKVVSFNILANRFTYYNLTNHKIEPSSLMRFRYKSIISLLWAMQADIYFLQEVDQHFYHLICYSNFRKNFYISYAYCQARDKEVNKDENGLLMIINKRQYFISRSLNGEINSLDEKKNHPLLKTRGDPSGFIGFNHITIKDEVEIGNIKKLSQILIVEKNHRPLILINCHFEGNPDRQDLRIAQFKHCCHIAQNCITKYNLESRILIGGDFNEPSQTDICQKYLSKETPFKLKLLNTNTGYTSNLRFQRNPETRQWETINRMEKLDYLIGNTDFKVTKETILPKSDITKLPDWSQRFESNIYKQLPKVKNWPSDHKLVSFLLEYEYLQKRTQKKKSSKKTSIKKRSNYKLL